MDAAILVIGGKRNDSALERWIEKVNRDLPAGTSVWSRRSGSLCVAVYHRGSQEAARSVAMGHARNLPEGMVVW